jgi:hypothetical protein
LKGSPMRINYNKPVWVYRNLKHGRNAKRLYSVMQKGRVVQRRNCVLLADCRFIVREKGRQRVLITGRKNVHAFVVGYLVAVKGAAMAKELPITVFYNPHYDKSFMAVVGKNEAWPIKSAGAVLLNEYGMTAYHEYEAYPTSASLTEKP